MIYVTRLNKPFLCTILNCKFHFKSISHKSQVAANLQWTSTMKR